jgi:glycosyltransferase involved in cell wall biosynthesis
MKIALVHDDLIQWGGAEKVLAEISNIFPDAPIYAAIADLKNPLIAGHFKNKKIVTSFLQKMPFLKQLYKPLLPLYPIAFEQFDFSDFDLVISQTTRFAKSIITKPETKHICYIHTPPRFLWGFNGEKNPLFLKPLLGWLRHYDFISAKRVDAWIAGSKNCQQRLKKIYQVDSRILYPFVDTNKLNPGLGFNGDYYLIVSRLNKYKKVDLAVQAFKGNERKLKIVGTGPMFNKITKGVNTNIEVLGKVNDELLESLMAGCRGLIIMAEEDFGMTSIEAQALGKGVIAYGFGGALETIIPGKTGNYFNEQTPLSLNKALEVFESLKIDPEDCYENAKKFSKEKFKQRLLELIG